LTGDSVTTAPPVFVLCGARSGSTLLRFILDAHPELACPPETNIPALCAQLSSVWYTDPERTAQEVFGFLGVAPVPGITKECFTAERERTGPADFKIWHTSEVSPSSIGRGWTIPAARIPPQILAQTNDLAAQLGYVQVDGGWGTTAVPRDLRTDVEPVAGSNGHQARKPDDGIDGPGALRLQRLLTTAMTRLDGGLADRWGKRAEDAFGVVVSPAADGEDVPIIAESRIDLLTDFLGLAAWPVAKFAKGELQ
jgi:hypothetical protein